MTLAAPRDVIQSTSTLGFDTDESADLEIDADMIEPKQVYKHSFIEEDVGGWQVYRARGYLRAIQREHHDDT